MPFKLHYTEKGTGETLILLHGNGENGGYFVHQTKYFSKQYRVISIDTRGHGKSERGDAPFTIRQFAEDLLNFMDEHGIEKADLLGFSDGGNIALIFAIKYPDRVNHLILNGANLNSKGVKKSVQLPIIAGYWFASLFKKVSKNAKINSEMLGLMVREPNIKAEDLARLHRKTLVIAGTKDMIKEAHTRLIYKSLPEAELKILPGDHFIANKNPAEFNRVVEAFLNS